MWEEIVKEETPSRLCSEQDMRALEARFDIRLPDDHRAFLATFGEGVVFKHIRIFGTTKISDEAADFRARWTEFFLWDAPDSTLSRAEVSRCVAVGDTFNGDEFALSPDHPTELFYLPQDSSTITCLGTSLAEATRQVIDALRREVARYPEEEQEEWDLRPVFTVSNF